MNLVIVATILTFTPKLTWKVIVTYWIELIFNFTLSVLVCRTKKRSKNNLRPLLIENEMDNFARSATLSLEEGGPQMKVSLQKSTNKGGRLEFTISYTLTLKNGEE